MGVLLPHLHHSSLSPLHFLSKPPSSSLHHSLSLRTSFSNHRHHRKNQNKVFSLTHSQSLLLHSISAFLDSLSSRFRRSRRIKTDVEICNDIREFLASVGLPEDHIPSTKELLLHGWSFRFPSKLCVLFAPFAFKNEHS